MLYGKDETHQNLLHQIVMGIHKLDAMMASIKNTYLEVVCYQCWIFKIQNQIVNKNAMKTKHVNQ